MEEMRSFGYICPHCGKAVLHQRSVFALSAAAARMECECGQEALEAETDGVKFRLWVPCGVCGGHHQAECSADAVLHGRGIGLACPEKQEICCYIGGVLSELKDIAARDGISCTCGSHKYSIAVRRGAVDLICARCGGRLRLNAATDRDLDDLCCQMKLTIRGTEQ